MTTPSVSRDRFNWARAAGIAYIGVAFLAGFAEFSVRTGMVVRGDAAATAANIAANQTLYSLAGIADLFVLLLDAFLGLAFWVLLRPVDKNLALLALFLNLLRLPWMGANIVFHFGVLLLMNGALPSFSTEQVQELAQLFLNLHAYGYTANGILFGSWCFVVGLLFYRSGFIPRLLGAAMMLALAGYWTDLLVVFLSPESRAVRLTRRGLAGSTRRDRNGPLADHHGRPGVSRLSRAHQWRLRNRGSIDRDEAFWFCPGIAY